jgi:hypothetical protein
LDLADAGGSISLRVRRRNLQHLWAILILLHEFRFTLLHDFGISLDYLCFSFYDTIFASFYYTIFEFYHTILASHFITRFSLSQGAASAWASAAAVSSTCRPPSSFYHTIFEFYSTICSFNHTISSFHDTIFSFYHTISASTTRFAHPTTRVSLTQGAAAA